MNNTSTPTHDRAESPPPAAVPTAQDNRFLQMLRARPWLLADGATGTNMFAKGLPVGGAPELWNIERPEKIEELHREFIEAGADIILTNTFGGTRYRLKLHQAEERVREINLAAARLARKQAVAADREVLVAGSMGPTGELLEPLGEMTYAQAVEAFAEQAQALADGGVDLLWPETLSSVDELRAAVEGASRTGLPVVPNLSFDTNGKTMMGLSPVDLAELCDQLEPMPPAYGTNCGVGASEVVAAILKVTEAKGDKPVLVAKANCGVPEFVDGEIRYNGTPELMAQYAILARGAGARIIGGCCGTTPEHLRSMRNALDTHAENSDRPDITRIEAVLGPVSPGGKAADRLSSANDDAPPARRGRRQRRR